jgi:predicted lysophospholipase L1 biosynthesis ABC-type transport system permease subunit
MARAMLGVAIMQALLAIAIATAPSSASTGWLVQGFVVQRLLHSAVADFCDFLPSRRKRITRPPRRLGIAAASCERNATPFACSTGGSPQQSKDPAPSVPKL